MSPFSPICIFFIVVLLIRNLLYLKFFLLKVLSFLLPSLILSFILFSFHCKQLYLSKTYLNSQFVSLYCFHSLEKKCNIILLSLQYNLVLIMPFLLTISTLLSANMHSVQTMPVLNASSHWPILKWQTIPASLSQTPPILQFHSKIPFFPKFMVVSKLLFSCSPPSQYNSLCNSMLVKTNTVSFCASTIQWPAYSTSPLFLPGVKPLTNDQVANISNASFPRSPMLLWLELWSNSTKFSSPPSSIQMNHQAPHLLQAMRALQVSTIDW